MQVVRRPRQYAGALLAVMFAAALPLPADAATWVWTLTGAGVQASGTFTTTDTPNSSGFVQITGIVGSRNGVAVTGLQPAGTAIPGNAGFPVDNLVQASGRQLTKAGFGFALADGTYSNPFFADFKSPPAYYEFHSFPPFGADSYTELPVAFSAVEVPEPAAWSMLIAGFGLLGIRLRKGFAAGKVFGAPSKSP